MITEKLYQSNGDVDIYNLYQLVRTNKDGTDKLYCYLSSVNNIDKDELLYIFDRTLWETILKWRRKKQEIKGRKLHNKFISYVWITVHNRYLDYIRKMYNKKNITEGGDKRFIVNSEIVESHIVDKINEKFMYLERLDFVIKTLPKKGKYLRWIKIIHMIIDGMKIVNIASKLNVTIPTIRNDVKQITKIFEQLNEY